MIVTMSDTTIIPRRATSWGAGVGNRLKKTFKKKRRNVEWAGHHPSAQFLSTSSWASSRVLNSNDKNSSWANEDFWGDGMTIAEAALEGFSDVGEVIDNLELLFAECNKPPQAFDAALLFGLFERVFDGSATALTYVEGATPLSNLLNPMKRVKLCSMQLYKLVFKRLAVDLQTPLKVLSIKTLLRGMVEYTLEMEYRNGERVVIRDHLFTRHGKVIRLERVETLVCSALAPESPSRGVSQPRDIAAAPIELGGPANRFSLVAGLEFRSRAATGPVLL